MAVEDKYVNALVEADKKVKPAFNGNGSETLTAIAIVSVAAADDNGSIYRLFRDLNSNLIPTNIQLENSAITVGTDWDLGLYLGNRGAVVDKDILADGLDLSSATTLGASNNAGLTAVALVDMQKSLFELVGQVQDFGASTKDAAFDIALTANVVGTAAGTIVVKATFVQG